MAVMILLFLMKSICLSKVSGESLSKPTMNPPRTSRPNLWIFLTQETRSRLVFWNFLHSASASSSLFHTDKNGFETRPDHELDKIVINGKIDRCLRCNSKDAFCASSSRHGGKDAFLEFLLFPMKLSSTKNTPPLQPSE
jgi:hypothetical protein